MKTCPLCRANYDDPTLMFCLSDGTGLIETKPQKSGGSGFKIIAVLGILAVLVLFLGIAAAGIGYYMLSRSDGSSLAQTTANRTAVNTEASPIKSPQTEMPVNIAFPTQTPTPTPVPKVSATPKPTVESGIPSATVSSPGDGFLALRTEPSADIGQRIAKIPHGTRVYINDCDTNVFVIAGKRGRWCHVNYGNQSGWVFDAFLVKN